MSTKTNDFYYNFSIMSLLLVLFCSATAMEPESESRHSQSDTNELCRLSQFTNIVSDDIDKLVLKGMKHIVEDGEVIKDNPKPCQQAYNVHYTLVNPLNRVHNIRNPIAKKYLCKELIEFFKGNLNVNEGLAKASSVWKSIADENDEIVSNYGYYVFHQKLLQEPKMTQYDWVIYHLSSNLDSRKAIINVNQPYHKKLGVKDYPCTISLQFFIQKNYLCCVVSSRSTDVYWGLPYNMGFFSFLTELVYKDLIKRIDKDKAKELKLGYVTMKTHFTQIYDKTRKQVLKVLENYKNYNEEYSSDMPEITDAQETLYDIYNGTQNTEVMKWIYENAQ